jgi:hypothetical protein
MAEPLVARRARKQWTENLSTLKVLMEIKPITQDTVLSG